MPLFLSHCAYPQLQKLDCRWRVFHRNKFAIIAYIRIDRSSIYMASAGPLVASLAATKFEIKFCLATKFESIFLKESETLHYDKENNQDGDERSEVLHSPSTFGRSSTWSSGQMPLSSSSPTLQKSQNYMYIYVTTGIQILSVKQVFGSGTRGLAGLRQSKIWLPRFPTGFRLMGFCLQGLSRCKSQGALLMRWPVCGP